MGISTVYESVLRTTGNGLVLKLQNIWRWIDWHRQVINFYLYDSIRMQKSHTFLLAEIMFMQIDRNARTNDWTKKKTCQWILCYLSNVPIVNENVAVKRQIIAHFWFRYGFFLLRSLFVAQLLFLCPFAMASGSCHVHTINALTRPLLLSDYVATFQQILHKIYFYWIFQ